MVFPADADNGRFCFALSYVYVKCCEMILLVQGETRPFTGENGKTVYITMYTELVPDGISIDEATC